jgi:uncharacterized protein YneF (UPF0154 family)
MLTENLLWIFLGLLFFVIVGVIAFFRRNQLAKTDHDPQPQERPNETGVAPITKKQ